MIKNLILFCLIHFIFIFIIPYISNNNTEKNNIYLFAYLLLLDIITFKDYL
jgi:hypothetical protein